jgi:hypothetical protein
VRREMRRTGFWWHACRTTTHKARPCLQSGVRDAIPSRSDSLAASARPFHSSLQNRRRPFPLRKVAQAVECGCWQTIACGSPVRGKSGHHQTAGRGESSGVSGESPARQTVSQKTDRLRRKLRARVKRRGKSPPPAQQCAGHEKPSAVQDKTGGRVSARFTKVDSLRVIVALAARAPARAIGRTPSGVRREMIVTRGASRGDRIRLIASKKGASRGNPGRPHFCPMQRDGQGGRSECSG